MYRRSVRTARSNTQRPVKHGPAPRAETVQTFEGVECTLRGRRDTGPRRLWCGLMGRTGERVPQSCVSRICDGGGKGRTGAGGETVRDKQLQEIGEMKGGGGERDREREVLRKRIELSRSKAVRARVKMYSTKYGRCLVSLLLCFSVGLKSKQRPGTSTTVKFSDYTCLNTAHVGDINQGENE